jgi:hypothetical protein
MLRRCSEIAAIGLCLAALTPAEARGRDAKGHTGPSRQEAFGNFAAERVVLSGIDRERFARELDVIPWHDPSGSGVAVTGATSGRGESRMLRSLPLHEMVDVGVGLFAVSGANVRERELKRTDPMRDVTPHSSRVAGAGLRVNF